MRRRFLEVFRFHKPRLYSTQTITKKSSYLKQQYTKLLQRNPNARPSTLIGSFLFLHEVTALLPLIGFFYLFQSTSFNLGNTVTDYFKHSDGILGRWFERGQAKVERVGRKKGWFGFEKGSTAQSDDLKAEAITGEATAAVTNAIAAFLVVKVR